MNPAEEKTVDRRHDNRGRKPKNMEELQRNGKLTVSLPPPIADEVREEATRQCLSYSAWIGQAVLKELRRVRKAQAA